MCTSLLISLEDFKLGRTPGDPPKFMPPKHGPKSSHLPWNVTDTKREDGDTAWEAGLSAQCDEREPKSIPSHEQRSDANGTGKQTDAGGALVDATKGTMEQATHGSRWRIGRRHQGNF